VGPTIGLYYNGARYLAAWLGRWTSADPIGMQAGVNLYQYCRGSPINYVDPSGTTEQPTTGTFDGTQSGGQGPPPPEEDWERQARESREPIEAYESARPWWRLEEATRYVAEEALGTVTNTAGAPTSERDAQWSPKSKTSAEYGIGVLSFVGPGKLGALFKEAGVLTKIFGGALVGSTTAVGVQALGDTLDGRASSAEDYGRTALVGAATGALTGAINAVGGALGRWLSRPAREFSLPKSRLYVPDIASRTTGQTSKVRNAIIEDISEKELAGVRFTFKPEYNPFLKPLGVAEPGVGSQIGPIPFNSMNPRQQVAGTMVHEELHQRWWARGIVDRHHEGDLAAKFNKTMERFAARKGWAPGTGE